MVDGHTCLRNDSIMRLICTALKLGGIWNSELKNEPRTPPRAGCRKISAHN
jgi:hypothetical protein